MQDQVSLPRPTQLRALPEHATRRLALAAGGAAVVVLAVAAFALVRLTGGSPNALNHLGYVPILASAYLFGWRGAVPIALLVSILLGPLATVAALPGGIEEPGAWGVRSVMFLVTAGTLGVLFARLRTAVDAWRLTAVEVAQRQRDGMIALARGAEAKDTDTGDHIVRCHHLSESLARAIGLPESEVDDIAWSAMLHDVGKLHVPDRILLKPGPLTDEEWDVMRRHPIWGAEILAQGAGFETARRIARWHHENVDGSGYPDGLKGDAIPLEARIVRIADAYDAMTHVRPYKPARAPEWAYEELRRHAGRQFDPELVHVFLQILDREPTLRIGRPGIALASALAGTTEHA